MSSTKHSKRLTDDPSFVELVTEGKSAVEIGRIHPLARRLSSSTVRASAQYVKGQAPIQFHRDEKANGTAVVSVGPQGKIRTLDDLLDYAQTDRRIWRVDRHTLNVWDVGAVGPTGEVVTTPLYQIKAWLVRDSAAASLVTIHDGLIESMSVHAPRYKANSYKKVDSGILMEFSPFDLHLGKLGWGRETGEENYDMKAAQDILYKATRHAIAHAEVYRPARILFPIGNDYLHTDNSSNQTTSGTMMDADTRHARIFEHGYKLLVKCIDELRRLAPVQVITVPGNHDRDSTFKLGSVLSAWYRNDSDVQVDGSPLLRKKVQWGKVLLGFTHGDNERHDSLPLLLAQEAPEAWGSTEFREIHLGHFHKRKETRYTASDTFNGVCVRILPSLSGVDAWHYAKGYVRALREAQTHLYSATDGHLATITSPVWADNTPRLESPASLLLW